MTKPLLSCGCAANAVNGNGKPSCAIHFCTEIVPTPNLENRTAICSYGKHAEVPSSTDLAFFEYMPNQPHDRYYCGCYGWE